MKLTKRELAVMRILWDAKEPLMASEIAQRDNNTIYSIQRIIKNLIAKELVEVSDIRYNKKSLARTFQPTVESEDIEIDVIQNMFQNLLGKNIATSHLIAAFVPAENDPKVLDELEKIILERKQQLLQGEASDIPKNK